MRFLALDPSTRALGWALWEDLTPQKWGVLHPGPGITLASQRNWELISRLTSMVARENWAPIMEVVCEKPSGIGKYRPAPQLETMVADLAIWTRESRGAWVPYHVSTIKSKLGLRGKRTKEAVAEKVKALYDIEHDDDNVLDAIAVGHCHVVKALSRRPLA